MIKKYIMTPGPTPISEEVLLEHARPLMHHRSPEFSEIFTAATEKLKKLMDTQNDVFILTSSGTGGMEAAVTNAFSPGDKVLVASAGNFGERFKKLSKMYGLELASIDYEWGQAVDPEDIKEALEGDPAIKGVMFQFSETSTGVLNNAKAIGNIVKDYDAITIVDAISGLGASEFKTDQWNMDIVIGGSQKGLSAPTGAAFISVSQKAWGLIEKSDTPRFYFNLLNAREAARRNPPQTPWTPAISIIVAINKAMDILLEEGLAGSYRRHKILAEATQRAVEKIGLKLLVEDPQARGHSVTAVMVPGGIDGKELTAIMRTRHGVTIAGGQGKLKGKIFRIGHLGWFGMFDVLTAVSSLEMALRQLGFELEVGSGVAEAQRVFYENNYFGN
ncbi:MAG: pyridoxal-phosphate-dependent aminotransferase family protein [Actinomycetota bacterium]